MQKIHINYASVPPLVLFCVSPPLQLTAQHLSNCKAILIYEWQLSRKLPPLQQKTIYSNQYGNDIDACSDDSSPKAH